MNVFLSLVNAIAMFPINIILGASRSQGRTIARMSANRRIEEERRRGITTVDASGRYNFNV